jgi:hypothetical protein
VSESDKNKREELLDEIVASIPAADPTEAEVADAIAKLQTRIAAGARKNSRTSDIATNVSPSALEFSPPSPKPKTWRTRMSTQLRKPLIGLAAAAAVALTVTLSWRSGGRDPSAAYAQAIQAAAAAHTATYKVSTEMPDEPVAVHKQVKTDAQGRPVIFTEAKFNSGTSQVMWMEGGHQRMGLEPGMITIWDAKAGQTLTLMPKSKKAFTNSFDPKSPPPDVFTMVRALRHGADEQLGEQQIDGHTATGFRTHGNFGMEWVVWVDTATNQPVRIEVSGGFLGKGRQVMSDFAFDVPLDESLFSITPPPEYTVEDVKVKTIEMSDGSKLHTWKRGMAVINADPAVATTSTEASLTEALKAYSEASDSFPSEMGGGQMSTSVGFKTGPGTGMEDVQAAGQRMKAAMGKMAKAMAFVSRLPADADWHYAGKDVKPGTANTPICWYKPAGSATYRVIYADLTVTDVTPENVPQIQPAK